MTRSRRILNGTLLPTPMPALHYAKTAEAKPRLSGDYYNCTLCHAAAAGVKDLVVNKAPKPAR